MSSFLFAPTIHHAMHTTLASMKLLPIQLSFYPAVVLSSHVESKEEDDHHPSGVFPFAEHERVHYYDITVPKSGACGG